MAKKVEKIVLRQKWLYKAKNSQISQTRFSPRTQEKKKPHRCEGAFQNV